MENYISVKNLSEVTFENEYAIIYLYKSMSLLIIEWKGQINLTERVEIFLKSLALTFEHQTKFWFIDARQTFLVSQDEKNWVLNTWVELASKSTIQKIAVVLTENYNTLMTTTDFTELGKQRYQEFGVIEHEAFIDSDTAVSWLLPSESENFFI